MDSTLFSVLGVTVEFSIFLSFAFESAAATLTFSVFSAALTFSACLTLEGETSASFVILKPVPASTALSVLLFNSKLVESFDEPSLVTLKAVPALVLSSELLSSSKFVELFDESSFEILKLVPFFSSSEPLSKENPLFLFLAMD